MHSPRSLYYSSSRSSSSGGRSASRAGKFGAGLGNHPLVPPALPRPPCSNEEKKTEDQSVTFRTRCSIRGATNDTVEVLVRGDSKSQSLQKSRIFKRNSTAPAASSSSSKPPPTAKHSSLEPPGKSPESRKNANPAAPSRSKENQPNNSEKDLVLHDTTPVEVTLNDMTAPLLPPQTQKSLLYLKHSPSRGNVTFKEKVRVRKANEQTAAKESNVEMSLRQQTSPPQQHQGQPAETTTDTTVPLSQSSALVSVLVHSPSRTKTTWLQMVRKLKHEQATEETPPLVPQNESPSTPVKQPQQHPLRDSSPPPSPMAHPPVRPIASSKLPRQSALKQPRVRTEVAGHLAVAADSIAEDLAALPASPRSVHFKLPPPSSSASIRSFRSVSTISMDSSLFSEYSAASTAFDYLVEEESSLFDAYEAEEWALSRLDCTSFLFG